MDKLDTIKKKIEELQTKSLVASDMKAFVTLVLNAVKVARDNSNQVSQETKDTLEKALNYLDQEHSKLLEQVSTSNEKRLSKIEKKILDTLSAAKTALIEVRAIKVVDGKDGAPGLPGEKGVDGKDGSPDTGEQIINKINDLPITLETQIDASHIKNLPKTKGGNFTGISGIKEIVAGTGVTVDNSNLGYPVITATGGVGSDELVKLNASDPTAGYLDDKITGYGFIDDISGLVPYTGATGDLDLGANNLLVDGISSHPDTNGGITITGADATTPDNNGGYIELKPGIGAGAGTDGYVAVINPAGTFKAVFDTDLITSDQVFAFPDKSGTFAMLDDVGGGGTPASPDTSIQFNDGGVFGGDSGMVWDKTNNTLTLTQSSEYTLGNDVITNGSFTGNTNGWILESDWVYNSDNVLYIGTGEEGNSISQNGVLSEGCDYQVSITIGGTTGNLYVKLGDVGVDGTFLAGSGVNTSICQWAISGSRIQKIIKIFASQNSDITIDDISIKRVYYAPIQKWLGDDIQTSYKKISTNLFEISPQDVSTGEGYNFVVKAGDSLDGSAIGGTLKLSSGRGLTTGSYIELYDDNDIDIFSGDATIDGNTGGGFIIYSGKGKGVGGGGDFYMSSGTGGDNGQGGSMGFVGGYGGIINGGGGAISMQAGSAQGGTGAIGNVSVSDGGTGYTGGDTLTLTGGNADATVTVTDATAIVLGDEEITNGDFSGGATDWTDISSDWTFTGGVATHTTGADGYLAQIGALTPSTLYKISFDVGGSAGTVEMYITDGDTHNVGAGSGTHTFNDIFYTSEGSKILFHSSSDFNGTIDNVSIKSIYGGEIDTIELTTPGTGYTVGTSGVTGGTGNDDAVISIDSLAGEGDEGGSVSIIAGNGSASGGAGGAFIGAGGDGQSGAIGADFVLGGGDYESFGEGGKVFFEGGNGAEVGDGGSLGFYGGIGGATSGAGGSISLTAGNATAGDSDGGSVNINSGFGSGSGSDGGISFSSGNNGIFGIDSYLLGTGIIMASINGIKVQDYTTGISAILDTSLLADTDKTFSFPDKDGTYALTNDFTYGEMYASNVGVTVNIVTSDTPVEIPSGWSGGLNTGFTFQNAKELICTIPGIYHITWSASVSTASVANKEVEGSVMLNGTPSVKGTAHGLASPGGNNRPITIGGSLFLDIAVNDLVSLALANHTDTTDFVFEHGSMTLVRTPWAV